MSGLMQMKRQGFIVHASGLHTDLRLRYALALQPIVQLTVARLGVLKHLGLELRIQRLLI